MRRAADFGALSKNRDEVFTRVFLVFTRVFRATPGTNPSR
jgi:hypothetical protein